MQQRRTFLSGRRDEEDAPRPVTYIQAATFSNGTAPLEGIAGTNGHVLPAPLSNTKEKAAFQRELHTVNVAISANIVIFLAKIGVYLASGSSAMLAESVHSMADIMNQVMLRMGILKSKRAPTAQHPYGYMRDKFVWSLISAMGIFCIGAGGTMAHGIQGLFVQKELEYLGASLTVLAVSLLLEGYSLLVACRTVMQGAAAAGLPFAEFVRRGLDPTSIAVMLEDGAAVTGLLIAVASTYMVYSTGNSVWDAVGSICIGTLLAGIALFLIQRNRQLLIGRSMNPKEMHRVLNHLRKDSVVKAVYDAKSEEIGPGIYRFKAEIDFSGEAVVARHMERLGMDPTYDQITAAVMENDPRKALDRVLMQYGKDMVGALGAEVDRLESEDEGDVQTETLHGTMAQR
ncbi:hypothetical protein WJX72_001395 [[Myrmecia] bisecta]|uniref:Cation efflux protein transmembrane domain-containing protein n=1 Tax=[Myrmecia] bisecta TaxID=41462 RepID=A0AAW1Q6Q3_9CHLO